MKIFTSPNKDISSIIIICSLGLITRLAALPFSSTNHYDAVIRVYKSWRWLEDPHLITHGIWPPLQTYLIAASMLFNGDSITSPVLLNIFFSVATVIPLYFFTRNEFDTRASWFVACAFLFYPIAFRNSLMGLSETPSVFFLVTSLFFLSLARKSDESWREGLIAGFSLTLSSMLRYEHWLLIPILGTLLLNKRKILILFLITSSLFPVVWMIGNFSYFGDPLYSINYQHIHENKKLVTSFDRTVVRAFFFPVILSMGMTFPIFIISFIGGIISLIRRKSNSVWLISFLGLFIAFFIKSISGSLAMEARYSIVLGTFLLPFSAQFIEEFRTLDYKRKYVNKFTLMSIILCIFPLSYLPVLMLSTFPSILNRIPSSTRDPKTFLVSIPRLSDESRNIYNSVKDNIDISGESIILIGFKDPISKSIIEPAIFKTRIHPHKILRFNSFESFIKEINSDNSNISLSKKGVVLFNNINRYTQKRREPLSDFYFSQVIELENVVKKEEWEIHRYQLSD